MSLSVKWVWWQHLPHRVALKNKWINTLKMLRTAPSNRISPQYGMVPIITIIILLLIVLLCHILSVFYTVIISCKTLNWERGHIELILVSEIPPSYLELSCGAVPSSWLSQGRSPGAKLVNYGPVHWPLGLDQGWYLPWALTFGGSA